MLDALFAASREGTGWEALRESTGTTVARAAIAGVRADRVGYAFALGYELALEALTGAPGASALCVTEAGGNHPRAIQTTLANGRVTGEKAWATLADRAAHLLVVAREGTAPDDRPILRVVRVRTDAPGVTIAPSTAAFVPEIAHARVSLVDVPGDVLPGDGYADYVKPFRTVEDIHVHAALAGYLIGVVRVHGLDRALIERLAVVVLALDGLGDPKARTTHLALAGAIATTRAIVTEIEAAWPPGDERDRWQRDRVILDVAGKARAERRARAWEP